MNRNTEKVKEQTDSNKMPHHLSAGSKRFPGSLFAAADQCLPVNEARKADTLSILSREIQSIRLRPRQNHKMLLLHLLRYADRNLPFTHLLSCLAMLLLLLYYLGRQNVPAPTDTLLMLSMTYPCFLVLFTVFEIRQVCFVRIAELHETCFFHVRQLVSLSMLLSGLLNLITVSAGILLVGLHWKIRLLQAGLYMLVPFIFMQCLCFGYMLTEVGRRHFWVNAVFTVPLSLSCLIFLQTRNLYTEPALFAWAAALFAGIVILTAEWKLFLARLQKGEILCTD